MKKKLLILLILISIPTFCGAIGNKVELRDNGKLIDLDKAIKVSPGGTSMTPTDGVTGGNAKSGDDTDTNPNNNNTNDGINDIDNRASIQQTIQIKIWKNIVLYNGEIMYNFEQNLEPKLRIDKTNGADFILVDDYAEADTYRGTLKILNRLKNEIGLKFYEKLEE